MSLTFGSFGPNGRNHKIHRLKWQIIERAEKCFPDENTYNHVHFFSFLTHIRPERYSRIYNIARGEIYLTFNVGAVNNYELLTRKLIVRVSRLNLR